MAVVAGQTLGEVASLRVLGIGLLMPVPAMAVAILLKEYPQHPASKAWRGMAGLPDETGMSIPNLLDYR
jgi:hypothetical protein